MPQGRRPGAGSGPARLTNEEARDLFAGVLKLPKQRAPRVPGVKRKNTARELPIHREILAFLRRALPPGTPINHSAAGGDLGFGKTAAIAIAKARSMGTEDGWPDLEVICGGNFYAIEVKAPGNSLSKDQKEVRDLILWNGGFYGVARSVEDAAVLLEMWGIVP